MIPLVQQTLCVPVADAVTRAGAHGCPFWGVVTVVAALVFLVALLGLNVALRRRAERDLRLHRTQLERLVQDRTLEVRETNRQLESQIAEQRRAEKVLLRREAILEAVGFAAEQFLLRIDWEESVGAVLQRLGGSASLCRVVIAENRRARDGSLLLCRRHEWTSSGTEATLRAPEEHRTYDAQGIDGWLEPLGRAETIAGKTGDFPENERAWLQDHGVQSVAVVPVFVGGQWWGFMEFDDCEAGREWSILEIEALRNAADILGRAIEHRRNEDERLRMADRVQRTQTLESLGVLAGGIAHDFNNILTGILGNADLALTELPRTSTVTASVRNIKDAAIRASKLTVQMLACSGKSRFVLESTDLNVVLRELTNLLGPVLADEVGVAYDLDDDIPRIQGDAAQLKQMIMGLVANASEAMGEDGGTVTVSTGTIQADRNYLAGAYPGEAVPEGRYVFLRVQDTGHGLDDDTMRHVFEPFFSTKSEGRGLGLPAILGIVRGHGGAIRLVSEPGEGTAFTVLFPADTEVPEPVVADAPAAPSELAGETVLVIDDEESIRKVTRLMLEKAGLKVLTAGDGPSGLRLFREHADDVGVTLLDLTMPGMSGDEVLRKIVALRNNARVLLTSGYREEDVRHRFAVDDMTGFIHKPFQLASLVREIHSVMGSVAAQPENDPR